MEQVLAKFGVDSIPFRFFFPDNISEHYGAELRLANEFQIIGGAYQFGGVICQPNRAADHGGEFFAAEGLKRDPQLQGIEAAAGQQGGGDQVGNALLFLEFGIEVIGVELDRIEMTGIVEQKEAAKESAAKTVCKQTCD